MMFWLGTAFGVFFTVGLNELLNKGSSCRDEDVMTLCEPKAHAILYMHGNTVFTSRIWYGSPSTWWPDWNVLMSYRWCKQALKRQDRLMTYMASQTQAGAWVQRHRNSDDTCQSLQILTEVCLRLLHIRSMIPCYIQVILYKVNIYR